MYSVAEKATPAVSACESAFQNFLIHPHISLLVQHTLTNSSLGQMSQNCSFHPLGQVFQDHMSSLLKAENILGSMNNCFHNIPLNQQQEYDKQVSTQSPLLLFNSNNNNSATNQNQPIFNSQFQGISLGYHIPFQQQQQTQQDLSQFPYFYQAGLPQSMNSQLAQGHQQNPVNTSQDIIMVPQVLPQVTNIPFEMFQTNTKSNLDQFFGDNLQPALRYAPIIQEIPPKYESPRIDQPQNLQPLNKIQRSAWKSKISKVRSKIREQDQQSQDIGSNRRLEQILEREELGDKNKEKNEELEKGEIEVIISQQPEDLKSTLICESHKVLSNLDTNLEQNQQQYLEYTLEDAQQILKQFWQKHQVLVFKYIDCCLDKSKYENQIQFQDSFDAVNLNTFAVTRTYNKKSISQNQQKGYSSNGGGFNEQDSLNQQNNIPQNILLKTEECSISSPERSRVNSILTQRNQVNNTLLNGSSALIPQGLTSVPARSASGSNTINSNSNSTSCSSQKPSRFQNLTKLLMYKIFKIFGDSSHLNFLNINQQVLKLLPRIMKRLKDNARDKSKQSDFINHSHYRALFLRLTSDSLGLILNKSDRSKDILNHKELFSVDLLNCDELDLSFCNILKRIMFKVFELYSDCENISNTDSNGYNMDRFEYLQLAKRGIRLMQMGKVIHSFDLKQYQKEGSG